MSNELIMARVAASHNEANLATEGVGDVQGTRGAEYASLEVCRYGQCS